VDAKHTLERVARLKQEMQELQESNALYRHRSDRTWDIRAYEVHRDRLKEIRAELAEMLDEFKQTGAN
jgi:hypothetical protein